VLNSSSTHLVAPLVALRSSSNNELARRFTVQYSYGVIKLIKNRPVTHIIIIIYFVQHQYTLALHPVGLYTRVLFHSPAALTKAIFIIPRTSLYFYITTNEVIFYSTDKIYISILCSIAIFEVFRWYINDKVKI